MSRFEETIRLAEELAAGGRPELVYTERLPRYMRSAGHHEASDAEQGAAQLKRLGKERRRHREARP